MRSNTESLNDSRWEKLKSGDEQAFTSIYEDHTPSLYSYGMRILGDEEVVQDILHNLFLKLWNNRSTLRATDNIRYFLLRSFKNLVYTYHTTGHKYEGYNSVPSESFSFHITPESVFIEKEDLAGKTRMLTEAINQLSDRQKEFIYLRYFEELEYEQIAELMSITTKAAYKLSARALSALKAILDVNNTTLILLFLQLKLSHAHIL